MDLATATSALKALKNKTTFEAAYTSYAAGHDSKHREAARAYSYNHGSSSGNDSAGYYQKLKLVVDPAGTIRRETKGWGSAPPIVTTYSQNRVDLSVADEKELLLAALNAGGTAYTDKKDNFFRFGAFIPAGFTGHLFRDGGKSFPKIADQVTAMVIVIANNSGNFQIVTHYPEHEAVVRAMTPVVAAPVPVAPVIA